MASQHYKTGGSEEYVIAANDAIIQCNVPSFVSDFVTVDSWVTSEGETILRTGNIGNLHPFKLAESAWFHVLCIINWWW